MSVEEIQSIRESLHRIETALVGDPAMGNKGIVARLNETELDVRKILRWRDSVKLRLGFVASVTALIVTGLIELLVSYFGTKQ